MINIIDLFAGAGGMSEGFVQTGKFNIVAAVEKNEDARKTYLLNHGDVNIYSDIKDVDFKKIGSNANIDIVIGGPPCQGFSKANKSTRNIINANNLMIKEYVRAIVDLKPKVFVLENVSTITSCRHRYFLTNREFYDGKIDINIFRMSTLEISICNKMAGFLRFDYDLLSCYQSIFCFDNTVYNLLRKVVVARKSRNKELYFLKLKSYIIKNKNDLYKQSCDVFGNEINRLYRSIITNDVTNIDEMILLKNIWDVYLTIDDLVKNDIKINEMFINDDKIIVQLYECSVIDYIEQSIGELYNMSTEILNAKNYFVPQNRTRFFMVGVRKTHDLSDFSFPKSYSNGKFTSVEDAISIFENKWPVPKVVDDFGISVIKSQNKYCQYLRGKSLIFNHVIPLSKVDSLQRFRALNEGQNFHDLKPKYKKGFSTPEKTQHSIYYRLKYGDLSPTVVNVRKSMWIHPIKDRAVSIREAARLQSFSDSYRFCGSKDSQYQQVGNAVPPILARAIAESVLCCFNYEPNEYLIDVLGE